MPNFTTRISATLVVLVLAASRCSDSASPNGKYDSVIAELRSIQSAFPTVSAIVSLGKNDDGRTLVGIRISAASEAMDPSRAGELVVGTQHGDEGAAAEVATRFARKLAEKFHDGTLVPSPLLTHEWWIVPVVNISGFEAGTREENGIDPNRDFPGPCTSNPGDKLASQRRLRELFTARTFVGVISLHGFIGSMTYPWGVNTDQPHTDDHATYVTAANAAAAINGYQTGTSLDVVYAANGTFDDWAYWAHGSYTMLVELQSENEADMEDTSNALFAYFGELPATPSSTHSFTGSCLTRSTAIARRE